MAFYNSKKLKNAVCNTIRDGICYRIEQDCLLQILEY